eukprot:scaffold1435_cov267-Pinguiococcus_pyrenoidosus.AAC.22
MAIRVHSSPLEVPLGGEVDLDIVLLSGFLAQFTASGAQKLERLLRLRRIGSELGPLEAAAVVSRSAAP